MPFFSFSINKIKPNLTKFNITANNVYFSKNTQLWKILSKQNRSFINFIKQEKRLPIKMQALLSEALSSLLPILEMNEIEKLSKASVLDTRFSPTINLNRIFNYIPNNLPKQRRVQACIKEIMSEIIEKYPATSCSQKSDKRKVYLS